MCQAEEGPGGVSGNTETRAGTILLFCNCKFRQYILIWPSQKKYHLLVVAGGSQIGCQPGSQVVTSRRMWRQIKYINWQSQ